MAEGRRYLGLDVLACSRIAVAFDPDTATTDPSEVATDYDPEAFSA